MHIRACITNHRVHPKSSSSQQEGLKSSFYASLNFIIIFVLCVNSGVQTTIKVSSDRTIESLVQTNENL